MNFNKVINLFIKLKNNKLVQLADKKIGIQKIFFKNIIKIQKRIKLY